MYQGGRWSSLTGWADVRNFATGGTGTSANPWTGWGTAVSALPANTTVYFPPGFYSGHVNLTYSNQWWHGAGMGVTTIRLDSNQYNVISNWNAGVPVTGLHHISVSDMTLDGNYGTLTDGGSDNLEIGIFILYADQLFVQRVEFINFWYGGMNLFGSRDIWITDNRLSHCGDKLASASYWDAIQFDGGSAGATTSGSRGHILNNTIENSGGGIRSNGYTATMQDFDISGNIIRDVSGTGINLFDGGFSRTTIRGNTVYNSTAQGIEVWSQNTAGVHPSAAPYDITISDNHLSTVATGSTSMGAIALAARSRTRIVNNDITAVAAGNDGIDINRVYDADGNLYRNDAPVISGNSINGAAASRYGIQAASDRAMIQANRIYNNFSAGDGIYVVAGGTDNSLRQNVFNSVTTPVIDSGTTTHVSGNVGYKTHASGVASALSDGGTVSHGLATTPNSVTVTQLGSVDCILGVSTSSSTTFTVTSKKRSDGTACGSAVNVSWVAEITGNE